MEARVTRAGRFGTTPSRVLLLMAGVASLCVQAACSRDEAGSVSSPAAPGEDLSAPSVSAAAPASFVNKVWQVRDSNGVVPGTLYAFFADGTLLITSPNSRPALGAWKYEGARLTMVEEGIAYPVDVLELSAALFRVRVHSPGDPLEIAFVPADTPPPGTPPDRRY